MKFEAPFYANIWKTTTFSVSVGLIEGKDMTGDFTKTHGVLETVLFELVRVIFFAYMASTSTSTAVGLSAAGHWFSFRLQITDLRATQHYFCDLLTPLAHRLQPKRTSRSIRLVWAYFPDFGYQIRPQHPHCCVVRFHYLFHQLQGRGRSRFFPRPCSRARKVAITRQSHLPLSERSHRPLYCHTTLDIFTSAKLTIQ